MTKLSWWFMTLAFGLAVTLAPPANAQSATLSAGAWLPGPDATGLTTQMAGTVDQPPSPSATEITGWVVDTTAQGWSGIDNVQIWNGLMNAGGSQIAQAVIQADRPDVAAALNNPYWSASGYSANVSLNTSQPGSLLYVYAHTPSRGWWYQQVIVSLPIGSLVPGPRVDIEMPTPLGTVHSSSTYTIRGSAFDPAATQGTGVDRVQVYLNGDRSSGVYIGDAKLGDFDKYTAATSPQFANAGWDLTFTPASWLQVGSDNQVTQLTVYAHSSVTGQEGQTDTSIVISVP